MRLLIDECLHESLVGLAHAADFEATHVNHLGLSGQPDWALTCRKPENVPSVPGFSALPRHSGVNLISERRS